MKHFMEHFGDMSISGITFLALGALVVALCVTNPDGFVYKFFTDGFQSFFTKFNALG